MVGLRERAFGTQKSHTEGKNRKLKKVKQSQTGEFLLFLSYVESASVNLERVTRDSSFSFLVSFFCLSVIDYLDTNWQTEGRRNEVDSFY